MRRAAARTTCPSCERLLRPWRSKRTTRGVFDIERCAECGFGVVNPPPSPEELRLFYAESGHGHGGPVPSAQDVLAREAAYPNSTVDAARMLGRARALLGRSGRCLDVGCGFGFSSREALRLGFQVTALELGRVERERAREIAGVEARNVAFEAFEPDGPFDVILMSQVLEHVVDPAAWMAKARALLVPGGVLVVALPSFDSAFCRVLKERDPYVIPPAHLNYFTHGALRRLVERHGLRVETLEDVTRLPADVVAKRLPPLGRKVRGMVELATSLGSRVVSGVLDRAHLGMMLNLYARAP
jgi:SAM-dependent methyltransferase